jgi:cobalt-zinc-cadmium efflux system membrane fusion protein
VVSEGEDGFIKLNGKVEPNEAKQAKVFALVSGKIQSVNAELGDYVKKGQVLAVLKSTEVAGISNDLSSAESNVTMTKKALETSKEMYDAKLATEQDYLNAKITYDKAVSELNRASQVAAITGGKSSSYTITSPISGFIIEKNITNNSEVRTDNNNDLFAIADLSNVWIMANVYEADLSSIHIGDPVKVNTLANPEKDYLGKIDKIYNMLDPVTRTMKVRITMDNPGNELKPEMFATIKVNGKASGKELTIPSRAIVMDNSKNYVVIRKDNKMEVREINLIKRVDSKAYISGLSLGDEVVVTSQLFLYEALSAN